MGKRRDSSGSNPPGDRQDSWKKIFKGLVDLIQDQQRQLESLVKERKSLERRIQSQHDRWVSDVKLLEDHISQVMRNSKIKDMVRFVDSAKANLIISMKQKEAIMHKLKFGRFFITFISLFSFSGNPSNLQPLMHWVHRATRSNTKDIDESALKAERDFAWNQFKKTDAKLQEHVKRTKSEVEAANERIQKLMSDLEQSQSANMEKNRTISTLQDDVAMLESDSRKKSEEISRLNKELELLRGDSVLRRCMIEPVSSGLKDKKSHSKGGRRSKRKAESEPRLFTSRFKVPKLKNASPS
ncbi:hypothetical protein Ccrd_014292 [Cynara cardunculus var. scolymus]|uniref:Uncharacterized protein n=1 Tax=Cynara cardunculus var. scolymus TaxID=59895 RepID=A0A103YDV3_CYNCS|nr:hypothetical protein Ccrd_014292 [Cynara cardunculus var. scolymus]